VGERGDGRSYPERLDLGGEGLRLSTPEDAETVTGWLADPAVHRFWGGAPVPLDVVRRRYTGGREPGVVVYLVLVADRPVGLLQAWRDPDGTAGLDLFLAARAQGRGTGPRVARALAGELVRRGWGELTADPAVENPRAVAAWARAGFVATGERGEDDGHETLLMVFRP
jgi:aminoglycoside 6'-N-acetyltransferase